MQSFTARRDARTADEIWLVQHPIPVVRVDRGGQITYHGPGQIVAYVLLDMKRRGITVRPLVRLLERAVIDLLEEYGVSAAGRVDAPGVYVGPSKVAALGLRIKRGCAYHGLALNVDMDLSPFHAIDPCGYPGLGVTQMRDLGIADDLATVTHKLESHLLRMLR
jgi:lipoyl(octanoyl) transferase